MKKTAVVMLVFLCVACPFAAGRAPIRPQGAPQAPATHSSAADPHSRMNARGAQAMGFSQTATTHHFLLDAAGGAIQIEANAPDDVADRNAIRMHLHHVARAFAAGDFDIPMFIHDGIAPGVPQMKRLRARIRYSYRPIPRGARIVISTTDAEAREAIWQFLRFQITEHKTGDPLRAR